MRRRGRPPHPDVLTPREWEVLALLRRGLTNQQIADRLGISRDGAKYHVAEIMSKLRVGSRAEAAAWRPERRSIRARIIAALGGARLATAFAATALAAVAVGVIGWALLAPDRGENDKGDTGPAPVALFRGGRCD